MEICRHSWTAAVVALLLKEALDFSAMSIGTAILATLGIAPACFIAGVVIVAVVGYSLMCLQYLCEEGADVMGGGGGRYPYPQPTW